MSNKKILLVDDELNVRETILELLVLNNFDVKSASNGQDALDLLDYWTPDLIICDIMMPIMNGNEFHRIVREDHSLSTIPFIFLTAKNEDNLFRKCLLEGADDFISKPFKINELIEVVESKLIRFEKIKNAQNNLYCVSKTSFQNEIKAPLKGILELTDFLIGSEENFEIQEVCKSIKISGEQLNRTIHNMILYQDLINNSLEFSDTSNTEISSDLKKVKEKIFQIYDKQEKRIRFKVNKARLKISEKHLRFILFELIDNAVKFSPKGKFVSVTGNRYNDAFYEIGIRDFGIGFNEDVLKKVSESQQINTKLNDKQGSGLGLYLSMAIIKKYKGVFSIVPNINGGTIIRIFFPFCE